MYDPMVTGDEPTYCSKGHRHTPGLMSLHWTPCGCETATGGGHHAVCCRVLVDGRECRDWTVPECVDPTKHKGWNPRS